MATTPSYVTFGLKIALLVFESLKLKYSYDIAPVYARLKRTYLQALRTDLPFSKQTGVGALLKRDDLLHQ